LNRYLVGGRVLKTVLAVTLAIFIAQYFELPRVILAAIVALLTVQRTFYHSLLQSLAKLGSVLLGGILGTAFSFAFGVAPLGYGLATLAAIYICLQLRWQEHIVLTTVTAITIIFSTNDMVLTYSIGQIFTAMVGAVCALAVNFLFTPNHGKEVLQKIKQAEESLREAVDFIMREMLEPGCDDAEYKKLIDELDQCIESGLETGKLLQEEQRFIINRETTSDRYHQTFQVFRSQLKRLAEMHQLARRMPVKVPHAAPLVQLFRMAQTMQRRRLEGSNTHYEVVERLVEKLEQSFEEMELPRSREEFVSRASLFHLLQEIKRYHRRIQQLPAGVLAK